MLPRSVDDPHVRQSNVNISNFYKRHPHTLRWWQSLTGYSQSLHQDDIMEGKTNVSWSISVDGLGWVLFTTRLFSNQSKFLFSLLCKHKLHVSQVKELVNIYSVGASSSDLTSTTTRNSFLSLLYNMAFKPQWQHDVFHPFATCSGVMLAAHKLFTSDCGCWVISRCRLPCGRPAGPYAHLASRLGRL